MSSFEFRILKDDKWLRIPEKRGMKLTIKQICSSPTALKFIIDETAYYFTDNDEVYLKLQSDKKEVRSIGYLVEHVRRELFLLGFDDSIFDWSLERIFNLKISLEIFPKTKVIKNEKDVWM